ncbi:MAG: VF530 family DNA-binding protein [Saprospiraceae bacterium]
MSRERQPNNPLHGVRLVDIMEFLVKELGWEKLGEEIDIRCFTHNPSIKSSLKFLRKTDWARKRVEHLYLWMLRQG